MDAFTKYASSKFKQAFNQLPGWVRKSIDEDYKARTGFSIPWEGSPAFAKANDYCLWVSEQPEDSDTSVGAWLEYNQSVYNEGLPEDFNMTQDAEDDPRTGYDYWELLRNRDK